MIRNLFLIYALFLLLLVGIPFVASANQVTWYSCVRTDGSTFSSCSDQSLDEGDPANFVFCTLQTQEVPDSCTKTAANNYCSTSGNYICSGAGEIACNASTPFAQGGEACQATPNACGVADSVYNCSGGCPTPPTPYTVGAACTSSPNACGATNGTVSSACTGACAPPANPVTCNACNNVNQCNSGYQCPNGCTAVAPADDNTPPTITIYNAPEAWTSNNVGATIGCGDNVGCNSSSVQYSTPLSNPGNCSTIDGYAAYNGSGVTITTHVWMCATATDTAGNRGYSSPVEFKVDQILPTSRITSPIAETWYKESFDVFVTDFDTGGSELEECNYLVYNNGNNSEGGSRTCDTPLSISSISSCPIEGTCQVQVYSLDNANNTSAYDSRTYNIDRTPPTVGQISISNYSPPFRVLPGQSVTLSALVLDPGFPDTGSGISSCGLNVSGGDLRNPVVQPMILSDNTASASYSFAESNTPYQVHATCTDTAGNTQSGTNVEVNASTCLKTQTPLAYDLFQVSVPTSANTKQCTITITHSGADIDPSESPPQPVSYETENVFFPPRIIAMSDNPPSSCVDNLTYQTNWAPSGGTAQVTSAAQSKNAGHDLSFGYTINSAGSGCVIRDITSNPSCASDSQSGGENACILPALSPDNTIATKKHGIKDDYSSRQLPQEIHSDFNFNFVECIQDSDCLAYPDKTYCNDGINHNAGNFPQNTCIDSVAPTSKITVVEDEFNPGNPPRFAPNIPTVGAYSAFLKAYDNGNTEKAWYMLVEDTDNSGDLDSCFISINGLTLPRACNGWARFSVGKPATGANCFTQGRNQCVVKVWATDKAGNTNAATERIIGDTLVPATTIEKDQQKYNDFTAYPLGFNVFWFGVDWTAPSAQ